MRFIQPTRATQLKIQASWACSGTIDWLKMICLLAVDAGGQEGRGDLARLGRQQLGILRLGDGVQVDHAVEALVVVLQAREVADRAEIVAEMEIAGRLHAGQDAALQAAGGVGRQMRVGRGASW